jgi:hypothetical protein
MCPGRFFAEQSLFLAVASVLSLFDILPAIDEVTGKIIEPSIVMEDGILTLVHSTD